MDCNIYNPQYIRIDLDSITSYNHQSAGVLKTAYMFRFLFRNKIADTPTYVGMSQHPDTF